MLKFGFRLSEPCSCHLSCPCFCPRLPCSCLFPSISLSPPCQTRIQTLHELIDQSSRWVWCEEDQEVPSYLRNVSAYSRNQPRIALYDARTFQDVLVAFRRVLQYRSSQDTIGYVHSTSRWSFPTCSATPPPSDHLLCQPPKLPLV